MIYDRLNPLPANITYLNKNQVVDLLSDIVKNIGEKKIILESSRDFSDADYSEMTDYLLNFSFEERTSVYWFSTSYGIEINYKEFCTYISDIWFPGADDIWVEDSRKEFFIEISHEEKINLWYSCPRV
jgi:hypothetical protein